MGVVIFVAMIILFAAAAYAARTWFGNEGLGGVVALAFVVLAALWALGGLNFGT